MRCWGGSVFQRDRPRTGRSSIPRRCIHGCARQKQFGSRYAKISACSFPGNVAPDSRQASIAFRNQRFEIREELIQEVIANSYRAWVLLVRRGKEAVVYPTPLVQYAIRQVRGGRRVGGRLNLHDILSPQARRHYGITIERIDRRDPQDGVWGEPARRRPQSRTGHLRWQVKFFP